MADRLFQRVELANGMWKIAGVIESERIFSLIKIAFLHSRRLDTLWVKSQKFVSEIK